MIGAGIELGIILAPGLGLGLGLFKIFGTILLFVGRETVLIFNLLELGTVAA